MFISAPAEAFGKTVLLNEAPSVYKSGASEEDVNGHSLRCAARSPRSIQARGQHLQSASPDPRARGQRAAVAHCGERAVEHGIARGVLGGRPAGWPSGAGLAAWPIAGLHDDSAECRTGARLRQSAAV